MNKILLASLALAFAAPAAQAHHVWLEQDGKAVKLQFGEFGDNQRETTPGLLDMFVAPKATLIGAKGEQALTLNKTAKGFVLSGAPGAGESIVAEDNAYPTWETKEDGKTLTHVWAPAARLVNGFAARQPKLAFDIVPTGKLGEFKVFYKGQPLPKVKVHAVIPNGWSKEAESDAAGTVKFDLPWKGAYVLEAEHVDKTPGERAGKQTASATYVTSLSFVQPTGVAAMAAGPVMAPNPKH